MWLYIFLFIALICLLPILLALASLLKAKYNLKHYEAQGIPTIFHPQGIFHLVSRHWPDNKQGSNLEYMKRLKNMYRDKSALAVNRLTHTGSYLYVFNEEWVREFLAKEELFDKVSPDRIAKDKFGFFYKNGHKLVQSRALFAKAFNYDRLSRFTLSVSDMIVRMIDQYCQEKNIGTEEYVKIDLGDLLDRILEKTLNIFIFGQETVEDLPSGKSVYRCVYDVYHHIVGLKGNLFYLLFPSLCMKYNLIHAIREMNRINKEVSAHILNIYNARLNLSTLGDCALDIIIQHNIQCREEGNMEEYIDEQELYGSVNLFQFAGTDTSQSLISNVLCEMAAHPSLQIQFSSILSEIFDSRGCMDRHSLDNNDRLNMWMKESLRRYNPIARLVQRVAKKDCVINKIRTRKGDAIGIGLVSFNFDGDYYDQPNDFVPNRFSKELEKSLPRHQFIPFGAGRRICLGRNLGELMSKLILCQFCKSIEFRQPVGIEYYTLNSALTTQETPIIEGRR